LQKICIVLAMKIAHMNLVCRVNLAIGLLSSQKMVMVLT